MPCKAPVGRSGKMAESPIQNGQSTALKRAVGWAWTVRSHCTVNSAKRAEGSPMVGVEKVEGDCGCSMDPARKPPPISVPPQISMTGL